MLKPDVLINSQGVLAEIASPSPDVIQITMFPLFQEPDPPYALADFDSYLDAYLKDICDSVATRIKAYRSQSS
ncbi:MAG: hypothetical protein QG639_612 [Patescibacteria group bacterium]|nr:hypothetical protein [Patescibacteria group bacterium]